MANWTTGLTTAAILGLVPLVLRFLSRQASLPTGRLRYGRGPKTIALLAGVAPPLAVAAALALQERPVREDEWLPIAGLVGLFVALGGPLVLEFFRVNHAYDEHGIDVASPWSPRRRIEWSAVREVRWRPSMKWQELVGPAGSRPVHLSPMLGGLGNFACVALEHLPAGVLERSPAAHSVLFLMREGRTGELLTSQEPRRGPPSGRAREARTAHRRPKPPLSREPCDNSETSRTARTMTAQHIS
jgi:hypothetical protein